MAATDVKFGITRHEGALIESVDTTDKIDVKELPGSSGDIARVHDYNPTTDFSVKGHGTLTLTPGFGDSGITDIDEALSGVTLIKEVKRSEANQDFDGWEYSGTHYPNAESVA